jgi:general secretion pathway protein C
LTIVALQTARLLLVPITPVDPIGNWRPDFLRKASQDRAASIADSFDPFYRQPQGIAAGTSLNLKLFGMREDLGSGAGSAIIGTPDGQQRSFSVGEEVLPGVTLKDVTMDGVILSRGGADEQLLLDPAEGGNSAVATSAPPAPSPMAPSVAAASAVPSAIPFAPRLENGRLTGVVVQPASGGAAIGATGLAPGDVIVSVNGEPIRSVEQARSLPSRLRSSGAVVGVERGGRTFTLRLRNPQ